MAVAVLAATMIVVATRTSMPAGAATQCLGHPPATAADYQSVALGRNAAFGVGDMTSAVQLPDGRRLFAFGDTAYYDVSADGRAGPVRAFGNNSAWVQSGNCFTLLDRPGPGPRSWILPAESDGSVYWPGAMVVVGSRLYVFLAREILDNPFGTPVGAAVATFDLPSLQLARVTDIPFTSGRVYGTGAVYDGGYLYVYASQSRTCEFCFAGDLYLARVPESQVQVPRAWQYRAGAFWTADPRAARPVLGAAVNGGTVQHYGNGFLLVTKTYGFVAPDVHAWFSPAPEGPWQDLGIVYSVPDPPAATVAGLTYQHSYTYNPVVLATTSIDGGLLGAYNVNSFDPAEAARDGRGMGPRFVSIPIPAAPAAPIRATVPPGPSPWVPTLAIDRNGRVHSVGGGVTTAAVYTAHAVGVARTPTGRGAWVVGADGGVFSYGDAQFYGSTGGMRLNQPIVGITSTPSGHGYWLVARDGGIFSFGDAHFYGSTGALRLNRPILAMGAMPTGRGYWLVASDGGIFSFGEARFFGSTGAHPPFVPVVGMAPTPDGRGYAFVDLAGEVFAFGDAHALGNLPSPLVAWCVGIVGAPGGYRLVDAAGNVFVRTSGGSTRARIPTFTPLVAAG